jgi:hypothetical protein
MLGNLFGTEHLPERGTAIVPTQTVEEELKPIRRIVSKSEVAKRYGVPQVGGAKRRYVHVTTISVG